MSGQELNAPAVSLASLAAGVATAASYIPEVSGTIVSVLAGMLAYRSWKNAGLKKKQTLLEMELTRIKISEHTKD